MKQRLLIIGPTPPPTHGVAVATEMLLQSRIAEEFDVIHVNTADRRGIAHVDKPDIYDVVLFVCQWLNTLKVLLTAHPCIAYLPISQSMIGFLRDSLFFWLVHTLRCKCVFHLHGGHFRVWYDGRSRLGRAYVRAVLRRSAQVVVLGKSLVSIFDGIVDPDRVAVVPNGIEWSNKHVSRPGSKSSGRVRVLYLGTLNRRKGALTLLAAVPLVLRASKRVEFVLAGEWSRSEDEREAMTFLQTKELGESVTFAGPVFGTKKQKLLAASDLFVFPGIQQEGQPLVVLEAMAAGLPVVYSNRGCLRETLVDGETGIEVQAGDPQDLADRIVWMIENPHAMARMGANARKHYEKAYTKERFVRDMLIVLQRAASTQ